jgi:hypothetical protein
VREAAERAEYEPPPQTCPRTCWFPAVGRADTSSIAFFAVERNEEEGPRSPNTENAPGAGLPASALRAGSPRCHISCERLSMLIRWSPPRPPSGICRSSAIRAGADPVFHKPHHLRLRNLAGPRGQIVIIDEDSSLSGFGTVVRSGVASLAAEAALGHVGIVLGLDALPRRNSADCIASSILLRRGLLVGFGWGEAEGGVRFHPVEPS